MLPRSGDEGDDLRLVALQLLMRLAESLHDVALLRVEWIDHCVKDT